MMHPEIAQHPLVQFCRSLPGTTEDVKWVDNLVLSVGKKMYAVFDLAQGTGFSFKTDPIVFAGLVQKGGIDPAPYLARHHWVKLETPDTLPHDIARDLLADSYRMVAAKLSKKAQRELGLLAD